MTFYEYAVIAAIGIVATTHAEEAYRVRFTTGARDDSGTSNDIDMYAVRNVDYVGMTDTMKMTETAIFPGAGAVITGDIFYSDTGVIDLSSLIFCSNGTNGLYFNLLEVQQFVGAAWSTVQTFGTSTEGAGFCFSKDTTDFLTDSLCANANGGSNECIKFNVETDTVSYGVEGDITGASYSNMYFRASHAFVYNPYQVKLTTGARDGSGTSDDIIIYAVRNSNYVSGAMTDVMQTIETDTIPGAGAVFSGDIFYVDTGVINVSSLIFCITGSNAFYFNLLEVQQFVGAAWSTVQTFGTSTEGAGFCLSDDPNDNTIGDIGTVVCANTSAESDKCIRFDIETGAVSYGVESDITGASYSGVYFKTTTPSPTVRSMTHLCLILLHQLA
jgi:hypothetical protein